MFAGSKKMGVAVPIIGFDSKEIKVKAYTNSWVTRVNVKITTVRIPETEMGITNLTNAPKRVSPSTIAASSNSLGMDLKKPIRGQMEKGTVKVGETRISAHKES